MRIITDFDGPIMDLSDRYYHVYQFCWAQVKHPQQVVQELTKAEYWERKRDRATDVQIGIESGLLATQAAEFKHLRDLYAHHLQHLHLDLVIPGAIAALERIKAANIDLLVMTLRRTSELNAAFAQYNLGRFFPHHHRYCLTDCHQRVEVQDKTNSMAQSLADLGTEEHTWMIGDTETDIIAAQAHKIKVIGVTSGVRNHAQLAKYQPDAIVPNLAAAVDLILRS